MILHKSQSYHTIMDLYFQIRHKGKIMQLVNWTTVKKAPAEWMIHLGQCLQWLIVTLVDKHDNKTSFRLAKIYIKDGFWRLAVGDTDEWKFCYMLPQLNNVGKYWRHWGSGAKLFTTGMVWITTFIIWCLRNSKGCYWCTITCVKPTPSPIWGTDDSISNRKPMAQAKYKSYIKNLVEVFVDHLIAATDNLSLSHLTLLLRAILHGVHSANPPPHKGY